jgi:DNA-directed RNA polymerase specialized sigma24 family protein
MERTLNPPPIRPAEDLALVARARTGDRVAQAKLYGDTWRDACLAFAAAWRLRADDHDVRAAADDVFADLCEADDDGRTGFDRYEPPPHGIGFRAFVRMIATRKALNAIRDRRARARKHAALDPALGARTAPSPEAAVAARDEVRAVLSRMDPAHVRALRLVDVDGVRIAEARALLGMRSYSAVNSLLGRARARARALRAALSAP